MYQETGTQHDGGEHDDPAEDNTGEATVTRRYKCDACRWHWVSTHPKHSRIPGECRFPHVTPIDYPCKGCRLNLPFHDLQHTLPTWRVQDDRSEKRADGHQETGSTPKRANSTRKYFAHGRPTGTTSRWPRPWRTSRTAEFPRSGQQRRRCNW